MDRRIGRAVAIGLMVVLIGATVAVATPPSGLTSVLLARGSWERQERKAFISGLEKQRRAGTSDVAVVQATLSPGGTTGWHTHPWDSVVVLKSGTLIVTESTKRGCGIGEVSTITGPKAFFHGAKIHKFDNPAPAGGADAVFYITYFAPAGAALADFTPAEPPPCPPDDDDGDDEEDDD